MIYFIECKDYQTRVPVNDLEEFHRKIEQVSGVNAKGVFISNSPLQKAAYNYAESVGMMLIQAEAVDNYKIVLHKTSRKNDSEAITFISHVKDERMVDQGVMLVEKLIDKKLTDTFNKNLDQTKISYNIDKLSKTDIEKIANFELDKIDTRILSQPYPLSPKTLYEFLKVEQSISIVEISDSSNLLGSCNIEDRTIGISKLVRQSPRELFVLAHEYGHFVLHQKLMIGQATYESFDDSEYNFRTNKYDLKNPKYWIEWQANHFASSLVVPEALFLVIVAKCLSRKWLFYGLTF